MKYISSKGEESELKDLNDFHLMSAAKKADETINFFTGFRSKMTATGEGFDRIGRYLQMVRDTLWQEVGDRDLENPVKAHFKETFPHLVEADQIALWNFMKQNFNPKQP